MSGFVDIHCHLLPGIDDGSKNLGESLAMARLSVEQGVDTITVTPHQLGNFSQNHGDDIRRRTAELQASLDAEKIPLTVLPGGDVRIEDGMIDAIVAGEVLTLGDKGKHVLLELPHELYFPLEPILDGLRRRGMTGILSHPERNAGLLRQPHLIDSLVDYGCLMQVTAGSLLGGFGSKSQALAENMVKRGTVHFLSTDAHGPKSRRPCLGKAFQVAAKLAGEQAATKWCSEFPRAVAEGRKVPSGKVSVKTSRQGGWAFWSRRAA